MYLEGSFPCLVSVNLMAIWVETISRNPLGGSPSHHPQVCPLTLPTTSPPKQKPPCSLLWLLHFCLALPTVLSLLSQSQSAALKKKEQSPPSAWRFHLIRWFSCSITCKPRAKCKPTLPVTASIINLCSTVSAFNLNNTSKPLCSLLRQPLNF